jgi:4'-phosphopantetheinyl transferase
MEHTVDRAWRPGPPHPELSAGSVHVWRVDTGRAAAELGGAKGMQPLLTPDERARAMRMRDLGLRLSWMATHTTLRTLLGRYLDADPAGLRLAAGEHGKPALAAEPRDGSLGVGPERNAAGSTDANPLSFNISHSGELALFAFTRIGSVGVDVEIARPATDHVAVAARVFGAHEARRLARLDAQRREREFLRLWTRHEAALKCRGTGFAAYQSFASGNQVSVGTRGPDATWIAELDVGPQAAGALVSELPPSSVRLWETANAGP